LAVAVAVQNKQQRKVVLEEAQAVAAMVLGMVSVVLELPTQVVVAVLLEKTIVNQLLVPQVVQVTHELLIGVNYGTTLRIS
jgi:hypothetical protein